MTRPSPARTAPLPSGSGRVGAPRLHAGRAAATGERLSERDWAIVEVVNRLRLMSGDQVERLCFAELSGRSRMVTRGRVLRRLVDWQVLEVLPRRIGGSARGSAGSVYALGLAGQRLMTERLLLAGSTPRVRHAGVPTERTVRHTLAVSALYSGLVEEARTSGAAVEVFEAEPASWWPNGLGGYCKPDAYVLLARSQVRDHWWVEADLATESLPTLKRKFLTYLDFVARGQLGPGGVVPRVVVTVPGERRYAAVRELLSRLPYPANQLFAVIEQHYAADYLMHALNE